MSSCAEGKRPFSLPFRGGGADSAIIYPSVIVEALLLLLGSKIWKWLITRT